MHLTLKQVHLVDLCDSLQTRHIVETLNSKGHKITSVFMSGTLRPRYQIYMDLSKYQVA